MPTKAKRKTYNLLMAAAIVLIAVCGIMAVGHLKGWFGGQPEGGSEASLVCSSATGVVQVERSGVGYTLKEDTVMQSGDIAAVRNGSEAVFAWQGPANTIALNEKSELAIDTCSDDELALTLSEGELFAAVPEAPAAFSVSFGGSRADITGTVFSVSEMGSAGTLSVYEGTVDVTTAKGESLTVTGGEQLLITTNEKGEEKAEVSKMTADLLSPYMIDKLLACGSDGLCFSEKELNKVTAAREQEKLEADKALEKASIKIAADEKKNAASGQDADGQVQDGDGAASGSTADAQGSGSSVADGAGSAGSSTSDNSGSGSSGSSSGDNSGSGTSSSSGSGISSGSGSGASGDSVSSSSSSSGSSAGTGSGGNVSDDGAVSDPDSGSDASDDIKTCTISIRCDTILDNMDDLAEGKDRYVPANGVILATSAVEFRDGETAYDVTKRACEAMGIQIEASYAPLYGSYYVEGIGHLYEFDCGGMSGWLYKVNGWTPNYGCSEYVLEDGDSIVWDYTCTGN